MDASDSLLGVGLTIPDEELGMSIEDRALLMIRSEEARQSGGHGSGSLFSPASSASKPARCMDAYENPMDLWIVSHSGWLITFLHEGLGLSPNGVTAVSIFFSVLALISLWFGKWVGFVAFSMLAYWMDDLDGSMARKYKLTSDIGEILDHASDALYFVGIVVVLAIRYKAFVRAPVLMGVLLLSALVPTVHASSGSRACGSKGGLLDAVGSILCPDDAASCGSLSNALKWFGGAGYQIILYVLTLAIAVRCSK